MIVLVRVVRIWLPVRTSMLKCAASKSSMYDSEHMDNGLTVGRRIKFARTPSSIPMQNRCPHRNGPHRNWPPMASAFFGVERIMLASETRRWGRIQQMKVCPRRRKRMHVSSFAFPGQDRIVSFILVSITVQMRRHDAGPIIIITTF